MRSFLIEDKLKKLLNKLYKKDNVLYQAVMKKLQEILTCQNIDNYKNLRAPLNKFKRVHVIRPFVLVFKYDTQKDKVIFYDCDHHDRIYK